MFSRLFWQWPLPTCETYHLNLCTNSIFRCFRNIFSEHDIKNSAPESAENPCKIKINGGFTSSVYLVRVTILELAASTTTIWKIMEIFLIIVDYFTLSSAICRFYGLFKRYRRALKMYIWCIVFLGMHQNYALKNYVLHEFGWLFRHQYYTRNLPACQVHIFNYTMNVTKPLQL